MGFAAPLGLLALLSLAIPVLLHLRRRPPRAVRIGTLRHLDGAPPHPRASARVSELLLLALRVVLLALAALAIARPFVRGGVDRGRPRTVTVDVPEGTDAWALLRTLDDTLPGGSSISLGVPERVRVEGARPALSSAVTIRRIPGAGLPRPKPGTRRTILLAAGGERSVALRMIRAAFEAVAEQRGDTVEFREYETGRVPDSIAGQWIVWLAEPAESIVDSLARSGAVVLAEDSLAAKRGVRVGPSRPGLFVRREGRGRVYAVAGRIDAVEGDASLWAELPELVRMIWPEHAAREHVAAARISTALLQPARRAPADRPGRPMPLATPLLVAAVVLYLAERLLVHRRADRGSGSP